MDPYDLMGALTLNEYLKRRATAALAVATGAAMPAFPDYVECQEERHDTERPSPMDMRDCYFCGDPATDLVYNGMPACEPCKRRAVGRRDRKR